MLIILFMTILKRRQADFKKFILVKRHKVKLQDFQTNLSTLDFT